MNLCINARDAMPQGGTLRVETGKVTVGDGGISVRPYVLPGNYVMLSITDSGTGMSQDVQREAFEPFYSTKELGKGTGLGLATTYGIVKQSGGYIWVDSRLGEGACFTIYLPKTERATTQALPVLADEPPGGTETLLIVEDEEPLRKGFCEFLSGLGYTVLTASSGEEALSVASGQRRIDLLLTDVVMPRMNGRELSQMLGSLRPELRIVFMSGYTDDAVLRHGIHDMHAAFLQKPFGLAILARKVRDTLGNLCVGA